VSGRVVFGEKAWTPIAAQSSTTQTQLSLTSLAA
jgi:hypothetical protein